MCFAGEFLARIVIATATSKTVVYIALYTLLPAASSLGIPVMTIAVKRYTPPTSARSLAFGLFYAVMNFALLITGFAIDGLRALACRSLGGPSSSAIAALMRDSSRLIIASGAVASGIAFAVTMALSPAAEADALGRQHAGGSSDGVEAGAEEGLLGEEPRCGSPGECREPPGQAPSAADLCAPSRHRSPLRQCM